MPTKDALLHERADVEVVRVGRISGNEPDTASLAHRLDALVDRLADIGLEHERLLDFVKDSLGFMERGGVDSDVQAVWEQLEETHGHIDAARGVKDLDAELLLGVGEPRGNEVDHDDRLGALDLSPLGDTD